MSGVRRSEATGSLEAFGIRLAWGLAPVGGERRRLSRSLLRALLHPDAEFHSICPECGGSHGPITVALPRGRAPLVSVSYSGELVVVGVAPSTALAFGLDTELDTRDRRTAVAEAIGSRELRDWTRLEAAAKARRQGLRHPYPTVETRGRNAWLAQPLAPFPALRGHDLTLTIPQLGCDAIVSLALTSRASESSGALEVRAAPTIPATGDRAKPRSSTGREW